MTKDNAHAAYASATGYLYQARLALLLAIRAIDSTPDHELRIEKFDDISFEKNGDPVELIQTKHHATGGNLTDASVDLWKTLRIWADIASTSATLPAFVLMTTSKAPTESAASLLKQTERDETAANAILLKVCDTSSNEENKKAYNAYTKLNHPQRMRLLQCITIIDETSNIVDVHEEITKAVRHAAPRTHIEEFVERLEGWWFTLVIDALANNGKSIRVISVDTRIDELRESFQRTRLPVDHAATLPPSDVVQSLQSHPFVDQLRLIKLGDARVEYAIRDYYRAYEQRARWAREDLLVDGEINNYDRELEEAWEPRFAAMLDELPLGCDEVSRSAAGANAYKWVEQDAAFPFRSITQAFLTKGSYHILANRYSIGWHPDYKIHAPKNKEEE